MFGKAKAASGRTDDFKTISLKGERRRLESQSTITICACPSNILDNPYRDHRRRGLRLEIG